MSPSLWRASARHLARHPWQFGLAVLGVALGVCVTVSIGLATGSARAAFDLATEAITGRATHQVVGGPSGIPEGVYRDVRVTLGLRQVAPVVGADVGAVGHPGRTLHLLGVDPFAEAPFRPYLIDAPGARAPGDPRGLLAELITRPGAALLSRETGRALGLGLGDTLAIRVAGTRRAIAVVGWIEPRDELSGRALDSLLVTDIATAQELLAMPGRLTRIDLILTDDVAGRAVAERLARTLPAGTELTPAGAQAEAAGRLTRAFSLNLTALSLLALLVGMFLIYNTVAFSVVQRRPLIGTLRALGVTRGEIFALVMVEALAVGGLGAAVGLVAGVELARALLGLVTRTINDLYFVLTVRAVWVTPLTLLEGAALGIGATLVAALVPALEAAGARPRAVLTRSELEARTRRAAPWAAAAGVAALAAAGGLIALPSTGAGPGFLALLALVAGSALLTPLAVIGLCRPLPGPAGRILGWPGRMAVRGVPAGLSRSATAIAALMIAVSATIGVGVMITSFRSAVARWLEDTLQADVYVSPPGLPGHRVEVALPPALVPRLAGAPGVATISTSRSVRVPSPRGSLSLIAVGVPPGHRPRFRLRHGQPEAAWRAFDEGAVLVSEPFAYRHGVRAGDRLALRTDRGERLFPVAAVFDDYASTAGVVAMSRATYDRFWDDRAVSALALEATPGTDPAALVATVRERAGELEVLVRSNRALREASLQVFDRTFAITSVLRLIIVATAFVGVLGALMAQALDRTREIGVLRALGGSPGQVWGIVMAETGLMGALAGVLAMPVGAATAIVLIRVVNRRSFGWTLPIHVSASILLEGLALALTAALLAAIVPARRMARASPVEALREE